jgi:hypothetical protein
MQTKHAAIRAQQRAIPPFVDRLLDEFGQEEYDGRGAIRIYFNHQSVRRMESALGQQPTRMFKRWLRAYKVESCNDGAVITRGWLTKRVPRR